jgi:hypothetical protein
MSPIPPHAANEAGGWWRKLPPSLALVVLAAYLSAVALVHTSIFTRAPEPLSFVVAVELVVLVPIVYWLLVVRRGRARPRTVLLAVVCSVLGARLVLPATHRSFVTGARFFTFAIELGITAYAIWAVQRALRRAHDDGSEGDVVELLQHTLAASFGQRAWIRAVAMEIATFYYALGGRGDRPPRGAVTFAVDASSAGTMAAGFGMVIVIEAVVMHLLLMRWSIAAAVALTGLSLYSLLWLVGDYRATHRRPVVLDGRRLVLRVGLRCHVVVEIDQLRSVRLVSWRDVPERAAGYLNTTRPGQPNIVIEVRAPIKVTTLLGLQRTTQRIGLRLVEPQRFRDAIVSVAGGVLPGSDATTDAVASNRHATSS